MLGFYVTQRRFLHPFDSLAFQKRNKIRIKDESRTGNAGLRGLGTHPRDQSLPPLPHTQPAGNVKPRTETLLATGGASLRGDGHPG